MNTIMIGDCDKKTTLQLQVNNVLLIGIKLIIHFQLKLTHTHTHTNIKSVLSPPTKKDNSLINVLIANPSNNWRSCNNELKFHATTKHVKNIIH